MAVVCQGPWRAGSLLWQPRAGAWALTVTCYAHFELLPGESRVVQRPLEAPAAGDERWFVEPWGPIAPAKARAEVVVVGHAYAPAGCKVTSLVAQLAVGDFKKSVRVHGDADFTQDGTLFGPEPFVCMPLRWDRAAGGPRTGNPAGVPTGLDARPDAVGRVFLPNLRHPAASMARRDQTLVPVGLGPQGPGWPARLQRLREHAAAWDPESFAERPWPDGLDLSYFNVAPPDQILGERVDTEPLALKHLHPHVSEITTRLRGPAPRALATIDGAEHEMNMRGDTLVIDADRALAVVVWRGCVPLRERPRAGVVTLSDANLTSTGARLLAADVRAKSSPPSSNGSLPWPAPTAVPNRTQGRLGTDTLTGVYKQVPAALPFSSRPPPPAPPATPPPAPSADPESAPATRGAMRPVTLTSAPWVTTPALPFRPPSESPPPLLAMASGPSALGRGLELGRVTREDAVEPPIVVTPPLAESPRPPPIAAPPTELPRPLPSERPPITSAGAPPMPPPGPPPPERPPPPPERPPPPPERPPPPPPRPTVASSLEHCGTVAGRLAQRPAATDAILKEEELSLETWQAHHARWQGEIQTDLRRGNKKTLSIYDAAYVAALEEDRGPITTREYGQLAIAAERGEALAKLTELRLPEEALPRIRRVWMTKCVTDPRLATAVQAATRTAAAE